MRRDRSESDERMETILSTQNPKSPSNDLSKNLSVNEPEQSVADSHHQSAVSESHKQTDVVLTMISGTESEQQRQRTGDLADSSDLTTEVLLHEAREIHATAELESNGRSTIN